MTHLDTTAPEAQCVRVAQPRTFPIPSEAPLAAETQALLQQVGAALDEHRQLLVHIHGLVALEQESKIATPAKENGNERQGKRRSAARSRERPSRRKGSPRGSRPASAASRIGGDVLLAAYEGQMTRLNEAYPTFQAFPDDDGMWLLARSSIISGLERKATFLVALPHRSGPGPRAWGFWTVAGENHWIGPRHTNFQDGSICAFSPDDGAWSEGGDLRTLLDLYSVWALRHLHLEVLGRWPGKQYGLFGADPRVQAYYRQKECQDDELCGCGSETRRYSECCKPSDLQWDVFQLMGLFLRQIDGGFQSRRPPPSVVGFIEGRSALPKIADVHLQMSSR
jgi:hypothetical protein